MQALIDDLSAQQQAGRPIEVVAVGSDEDGIAVIGSTLAGRSDVSAVHVIGHGASGVAQLGASELDAESVFQRAGEIAGWGDALSADADLLLYGCDVGDGEAGQSLVATLAQLTGADVAASDDPTGSALLGGDWDLEVRTGAIEATPFASANLQVEWSGVLALTAQGSETRVNTTTSGTQTENWSTKTVAMDANGNYVVIWMDGSGATDTGIGIYGQRYNASGVAQGAQFHVNTYTADNQRNPTVAMDANGNFVVVWESNSQDGSRYGIYAQRYNSSGVAQGSEFRVNTTTTYDQLEAAVAMDASGNFVIAWHSWSQDAVNTDGIYAQRYNSSGVAQGSEFLVNTYTTDNQTEPSVAMDASGNFVIAWQSFGQDGDNEGIYAKRYNSSGVVQGSEFHVSTYTTSNQDLPVVAMDSSGNFVVVWESNQDGSGNGIYGQRYNSSGAVQGGEFRINTTTINQQQNPVVTMLAGGGFVVVWQSTSQDGSFDGVYMRQYDSSGTALTAETLVNTTTTDYQDVPSIAADEKGHLVVVWHGNGPGDTDGVFMQRYQYAVAPVLTLTGYSGTYVENAGVIYDAGATVTDADTTTFTGGQLIYQITANGTASDELGIRNQGTGVGQIGLSGTNVTYGGTTIGTYSGSFGNGSTPLTVTFNSNASVAAVQALVRNVTYRNTSENPSTATRSSSLTVSDGTGLTSAPAVVSMAVTAVNDPPIITSNGGGSSAAISMAENNTTVSVVAAADAENDVLTYSIVGGVDSARFNIDPSSGVLRFISGPDYENPSDSGTDNIYNVIVQVTDGSAVDTQALAITVTNVDEQIHVDASSSAITAGATSLTWSHTTSTTTHGILIVTVAVRKDVPVTSVTYGGTALTHVGSQVDPSGKVRAEMWYLLAPSGGTENVVVSLSGSANATAGATSFYNVSQNNPFGSVTAGSGSGDPSLTLVSAVGELVVDSVADRDVDSQVVGPGQSELWTDKVGSGSNDSWGGSSAEAGAASVTMSWTTNGAGAGEWAAVGLSLKPFVNHVPTVTTTASALAYTENSGATLVDNVVTVSDSDGDSPVGATVSITSGFASGQDTLAFTDQSGITGSWNVATGVLTLSGSATVANYQAALRSVTYVNTSDQPVTATRTVSFAVNDGLGTSATATRNISVASVDDAPSFNAADYTVTTAPGAAADRGYATLVQGDGKILVAGYSSNGSNLDFLLMRYNVDGTLDTSFGGGDGMVTTAIGSGDDEAHAVALQSEGRILVAGFTQNGLHRDFALVRYLADGTLDTSFGGGDGIVTTDLGGGSGDEAWSMVVQTDGRIVLGGTSASNFALVRYNTDGSLDTSFSGDGMVSVDIAGGSSDNGYGLALQSDGKLVQSGSATVSGTLDFGVVRYNTDGSLDTSFGGGDGIVTTPIGASFDIAQSVAIQSDGKIVVGGYSTNGSNNDFAVVRYTSAGAIDTGFGGGDGIVTVDFGGHDSSWSTVLQSDGRIVMIGGATSTDLAAVRLLSDGSLDTSFSGDGKFSAHLGTNSFLYSAAIGADGRVVATGYSNTTTDDVLLVRLSGDGQFDTRSNPATTSLGGSASYTENGSAAVIDSSVRIFDAELNAADSYAGATLTLARSGGANAQDVFSASGNLGTLTQGGSLLLSGVNVGTVTTNSSGTLLLTFNASATQVRINEVMSSIAYANSSDAPPASVSLAWTFSDGNSGGQGSGGAKTATGTSTINITAVNDAPTVTSSASASVAENTTAVMTVTSSDVDGGTPVYSISGGVDAAKFSINSTTGALSFLAAPNYESPTDAGGNNVYDVTVQVSDGFLTDTQAIAVTVRPVNDNTPAITSGASASVAENSTAVMTVTATDADLPAQTLSYSIVGG
ncbi:DUF4347 domain-containing protein, partial [uncultured Zoogloea sp.]|uniref:DUF4347 domain-containing protein n=1 Tax=uncultured Zoogloea sp. TaxID=160237 RepID=UPI002639D6E7